jgi:hypothetical protein
MAARSKPTMGNSNEKRSQNPQKNARNVSLFNSHFR